MKCEKRLKNSLKNNPRYLAFYVLETISNDRQPTEILKKTFAVRTDIRIEDKRLVHELVYGCVRRKGTLDFIISCYTSDTVKRIHEKVRVLLRIGIYQLKFMDKIPDFAAINETVQIAKNIAGKKSAGFVNAILRATLRNPQKLADKELRLDPIARLAYRESHPEWLIRRLLECYSPEDIKRFCSFNNSPPPVSLRLNPHKISRDQFCARLTEQNIAYKKSHIHPDCVRLLSAGQVNAISGYDEGLFIVQDETPASILDTLSASTGEHILDICAAPGGKTCVLAQQVGDNGTITALDLNRTRMNVLRRNIVRLRLDNVKTIIGDVSKFQELRQKLNNTLFDKIVVDPPCSNTGVLRKRIEARWRLNVSDFKRLAGLQIEILRNASQFLKHGGLLLYETCSIDPEENQYVISGFLESNPDFNLIKQQLFFPTTPQASDGGFGALLKRVT